MIKKLLLLQIIIIFLACKNDKKNGEVVNSEIEIVIPTGSERPQIFMGGDSFKNETAKNLNSDGVNFIRKGEYLNAEEKFIEALNYEPDNPAILSNIGTLTKDFGDKIKAIEYFEKSIYFSDSTYFNAVYNLGLTYCNMGRFKESEELLTYILNNFDNKDQLSATNFVLANVYLNLKDCKKAQLALNHTKSFYENNPEMIVKLNNLKEKVQNCSPHQD